jgi:Icc-related predicted phosphoesterase
MKIQFMSDLHLEFSPVFRPEPTDADVLVLSGDILVVDYMLRSEASPYYERAEMFNDFLLYCANNYQHVIYVMGNHEHYYSRFDETAVNLRALISRINLSSPYGNIHLLDKQELEIDDVLFVGATLWTDANKGDPVTEFTLEKRMNDYSLIQRKFNGVYRKLRVFDTVIEHQKSLKFIEDMCETHDKIVVATHHAPTHQSVDRRYKDQVVMNGGYASNLDSFIFDRPQIKLWIHGHMHANNDYMVGETRVMSNPRGYNDENPHFINNIVVEV